MPSRPNAIGLSVVELVRLEGGILHLDCVDIMDGTPLLDSKPYTAKFDRFETVGVVSAGALEARHELSEVRQVLRGSVPSASFSIVS